MEIPECAINAIWQIQLNTPEEKQLIHLLATKHELGEKKTGEWKAIKPFLESFTEIWCHEKELRKETFFSKETFDITMNSLIEQGYVQQKDPKKANQQISMTRKVFDEFRNKLCVGTLNH